MEPVVCAFCSKPIDASKAWIGSATKLPYCPDEEIEDCLAHFASRVEYIDCTYRRPAQQAA